MEIHPGQMQLSQIQKTHVLVFVFPPLFLFFSFPTEAFTTYEL